MKKLKPETIVVLSMLILVAKLLYPIVMKPIEKKERLKELISYGSLFVKERPDLVAVDGQEFDDSMTIVFRADIETSNSEEMKYQNELLAVYFHDEFCGIGLFPEKPDGYILNIIVNGKNARLLDRYFKLSDCKSSVDIARGAHN